MYKNGFIKVMASTPKIIVGDIANNQNEILKVLNNAKASLIVFPELAITGYSASDLFYQHDFLNKALDALAHILKNNLHKGLSVIGMPLDINGGLINVGVVIQKDKILGVVPKYFLPNNQEFSEKRWFIPGSEIKLKEIVLLNQSVPFGNILFKEPSKNITVGIEICQDMWSIKSPSDDLAMAGANVILNLSASTELVNKELKRKIAVLDHSRKQMVAYAYTTSGIYESSAEALFSSQKLIAVMGNLIKEGKTIDYEASYIEADINIEAINYQRRQDSNYRDAIFKNEFEYQEVYFELKTNNNYQFSNKLNLYPFIPQVEELDHIKDILVASLVKKILSLPEHLRKIVIGVSGGLDSTHALIIAREAFLKLKLPLKDIHAIIMPASASNKKSMEHALKLVRKLNLEPEIIDIEKLVNTHLKDIKHDRKDTTYENVQARIRTLTLMNLANKYGGIVLGTGDLSEIALGFMTYNGDQMSMYAINSGLPKTLIQELIKHYANKDYSKLEDVLLEIVEKPISPELLKNQKTEDIIGSYQINDFIMYYHLEEGLSEEALTWLVSVGFNLSQNEAKIYVDRFIKLFYNQQFKRSTLPEGPKVFDISLSPRNSYKLPSDIKRK